MFAAKYERRSAQTQAAASNSIRPYAGGREMVIVQLGRKASAVLPTNPMPGLRELLGALGSSWGFFRDLGGSGVGVRK